MTLHNRKYQSGVVLIVSLVIMSILTIVVLAVNSSTLMQERMSAAVRQSSISLEKAEQTLREVESVIDKATTREDLVGDNALVKVNLIEAGDAPDPFDEDTWKSNTINVAKNGSKFFIEELGTAFDETSGTNLSQLGDVSESSTFPPIIAFRIVARGIVGEEDNIQSQRILVSYYSKRLTE
ncbi:MAG: PilX N-terminal domain-containing pilus assembly protein [Pseudomonadota bacterium]